VSFFHPNLEHFWKADAIDSRLRKPPSRLEAFALAFAIVAIGLAVWVQDQLFVIPFDYNVYFLAAGGTLTRYYYAIWILPLFKLWAVLPFTWGYVVWALLSIPCIYFAGRIFGGPTTLTLISFQMLYGLYMGQITSLLVFGLALGWWGLAHRRWHLAGLGFWLASTKFQIGLPFGFLLWLTADISWRDRLRVLILPACLSLLSLILYPGWPQNLVARLQIAPPYDWASISLWQWIGPAALLFWLPPLFIPMDRGKKFLSLVAAIPLTMPYFQQADLLALFVLPVGWLPVILGNLGYLFFKYNFQALKFLSIVPLSIYLGAILPAIYIWMRAHIFHKGQ